MKLHLSILFLLISFSTAFSQDKVQVPGHFDAIYDVASGTFSYQPSGEMTKDGVELIDLKLSALDKLLIKNQAVPGITEAVAKEKASLDQWRHRLLVQRERLIKPLPPLEEVK